MDFKKQTTYSGKIKELRIVDGQFIDKEGEIINLAEILGNVYTDMPFDLSTTAKSEEAIDIEPDDEVDIDDLSPDGD